MKKPNYTSHNGFLMPKGFPVEGFTSGINYEAEASDIFVATYPKCGTTWTLQMVWLITHHGEPFAIDQKIDNVMPHLEERGKEFVEKMEHPRIIKTHLPYNMTPQNSAAKYIYVARNPFDCAVSFYHHTRGFVKHYDFENGKFDDFFECFVAGQVDFGDYFENLQSWHEHKDESNILFLTYENMKADIRKAIIEIATFIGYGDKIKEQAVFDKIILNSSFESMSQNQQRWSSKRPDHMPPFIRKGKVGDWKNHFSEKQERRLQEKMNSYSSIKELWSSEVFEGNQK